MLVENGKYVLLLVAKHSLVCQGCSQSELCSSKLFRFEEGLLCGENWSADFCTTAAYLVGVTVAKNSKKTLNT